MNEMNEMNEMNDIKKVKKIYKTKPSFSIDYEIYEDTPVIKVIEETYK